MCPVPVALGDHTIFLGISTQQEGLVVHVPPSLHLKAEGQDPVGKKAPEEEAGQGWDGDGCTRQYQFVLLPIQPCRGSCSGQPSDRFYTKDWLPCLERSMSKSSQCYGERGEVGSDCQVDPCLSH